MYENFKIEEYIPGFPFVPFLFPMGIGFLALGILIYSVQRTCDDMSEIRDRLTDIRDTLRELTKILQEARAEL
ncbi:MAG: hypothetical protein J7M18_08420 [Candidatus Eremiobacteraeota bacterium]|nr:hypothetical protein [Candidatus Eremiobacteraeota bacterium]